MMPMEETTYFHLKYAQEIGKGRKYARQMIWSEIKGNRDTPRLTYTF